MRAGIQRAPWGSRSAETNSQRLSQSASSALRSAGGGNHPRPASESATAVRVAAARHITPGPKAERSSSQAREGDHPSRKGEKALKACISRVTPPTRAAPRSTDSGSDPCAAGTHSTPASRQGEISNMNPFPAARSRTRGIFAPTCGGEQDAGPQRLSRTRRILSLCRVKWGSLCTSSWKANSSRRRSATAARWCG